MAKRVSKSYAVSLLVVAVVMLGALMVTNVSAQDYPPGMVAYWKFDERSGNVAYDSVGANHGNIVNSPAWTIGEVGGALRFDGVDDYVRIPHNPALQPTQITVNAWIKANPSQVDWHFLVVDKSHGFRDFTGWALQGHRDTGRIAFVYGDSSSFPEPLSTTNVLDDNWHFVTGTLDGSTLRIYVDGVLEGYSSYSGTPAGNNRDVNIGVAWGGGTFQRYFNGLIDEVAIYNRALTPEEIQQHYQNGLKGLGYELNRPPIVDAGPNITIDSMEIPYTKLYGTASDPDGDFLTYRWLIDAQGTEPVSQEGNATLDLANILREGEHEAILEVSDVTYTASDSMILTVNNSLPVVVPQVSGTYKIGVDVILRGDVADFDGDTLTYKWYKDSNIYDSGSINTYLGGAPVSLPSFIIQGGLPLGSYTIILEVEDGHNPPVIKRADIDVVDTEAPTLAPTAEPSILWPPNHTLVPVVIYANAQDNSGFVTLSASVSSSEPPDTGADGNTIPDFTEPQIDQSSGIITLELRAERKGKGVGRTYTITITATDESNNTSRASIEVIAPHDRGN